MKPWLKWLLGIAVLVAAAWYFFLKDYHYQVSFRNDRPALVIYNHIMDWPAYDRDSLEIETLSSVSPSEIIQNIRKADSSFTYRWEIQRKANETVKVTAYITDNDHDLIQKLKAPFGNNDFVSRSIRNTKTVARALQLKSETYKVHSIKDTVVTTNYCACLALSSTVEKKAATMLQNIGVITNYIHENSIEIDGDPFLEVTRWDQNKKEIDFNFCFPVKEKEIMPPHTSVKLKTGRKFSALKAEFNGNYRNSHYAWYYLLDHADSKGVPMDKLPLEIYLNDPHVGGDPLQWKALIFLPLSN